MGLRVEGLTSLDEVVRPGMVLVEAVSGGVFDQLRPARKVDVRLLGKGNSNSHGARPVHLIIMMIKWIRTSRLSIENSLSLRPATH